VTSAIINPPLTPIRTADLRALARHYAADPNRWPMAPRFSPAARWYARIAATDDHEAWLLTWLPGQETDLHDHGGSAGAFTVLTGALTEFSPHGASTALAASDRAAGSVRGFGPRHIHLIRNTGAVPAVSVHVYSPALTRMTRYELAAGKIRVVAVERAGADW
jgi:hypothetical protein